MGDELNGGKSPHPCLLPKGEGAASLVMLDPSAIKVDAETYQA